ncbi:MAG: hypothetical protein AB7H77_03325 [Bdellovibrionales bacterium]
MKVTQSKSLILGLVMFGSLALAGCENMARLTPANPQAEALGGEIPAHFTTFSAGNGTIEAIGPGGEVIKGSYGPAPAEYKFGDIFKAVYGEYSTNPVKADNGTPSTATLTGNMGTSMQCEFYDNESTRNGFGGCKSVTGALYRLTY